MRLHVKIWQDCQAMPRDERILVQRPFYRRGFIISGPNPEIKPTREDWEICVSLRQRWLDERHGEEFQA